MKFVKWLLIAVVAVVVLAGVAVIALPYFVPMDRVVAEGAARVEQATGRKLIVGGKPELSIWPEVAIKLDDVRFQNAPGAPDAEMATLKAVRIAVPVLPLLSGAVEVKEFVLVEPDIRLFIDKDGRPNWSFGKTPDGGQATEKADGGAGGLPAQLTQLRLGEVRIEDGRISYEDAQSGAKEVLEDVDVAMTLPSLSGPLTVDGAMTWKGERVDLDLEMANPLAAIEKTKSQLKLTANGDHLQLAFDGTADFAREFALAGKADVKTPSLKKLAAWAAAPIEAGEGVLGPFETKGQLTFGKGRIAFTGASLAIDEIRGDGDFAVDTTGKVPSVTAKLALGALDLNPYMPAPEPGDGGGGAAGSGPGKWSDEPIDFSGLRAANAALDLSVESLQVQQLTIGESNLTARLNGGVLQVNLTKMALYGGSGTAKIDIDASKGTPRLSKTVSLKGIDAQPLLADAADFDRLSGKGDLDLTVAASGASEAAIVGSTNGKGAFAFRDGAIVGFNLGAMLRKTETAFLDASAGKQQQTDFTELTASFDIKNGVVSNQDLAMLSPLFRVGGAGTVDMPARTVDYRVEPKAVASREGQGGKADADGLAVPVLIKGPWHDISYQPDLAGVAADIAKDPSKAIDAVKGVTEGVDDIKKDPTKKLKGLFGK